MALSATEAAQLAGVSKSAILKAIKSGKISASKNQNDEWRIEPVELARQYDLVGDIPQQDTRQSTPHSAEILHQSLNLDSDRLQREVEHLRELLVAKDEVIAAKEDALEDLRRAMLLLTTQAPQPRSWWQRMWGG